MNKLKEADKFMNAARITAEEAIQAASEENKLKIAQLQADVSRENNKLVQETNMEIRSENNKPK